MRTDHDEYNDLKLDLGKSVETNGINLYLLFEKTVNRSNLV